MLTAVNPTAGAGARTPDATPDATRTALREARRQNALRLERIRESRLAVIEHRESRRRQLTESLSVDWVTPYAELLDLTRRTGDPVIAGPTAAWQRRQGKNWPIYQTEQELNLLRAPARVLFGTNGYAQGLVEGIKSYVLGTGNTYRVAKEDDKDDLPDDAVDAAQNVVDKFLLRTQWFGGELPGIEEELLERSMVDGEFVLCHYPREDGTTDVRTQEPEMLTCPPHADWREWSFGVRTPYDDAQDQQAFWIQHGDSPEEGEEYGPDEITFFRRNVTRAMKRGVTDFCFDTYDALYLAGRLRTNLGDTAAQQAAIVAVRQHDSGTKEDIQSFIDADATLTQTEPITGTQLAQKIHRRGSWEDIPKGMNYVPGPTATSTPIHLQVLDACLRGAGQKWQAPPWLMSGDLNAMNYATSLTAESPFVRTVQRRQRSYCEAYRRPVWFALRHWVQTNGLRDRTGRVWSWEEIEGRIKLQVTSPSPETRDKLQDAQRAQIEIPLGVQSRQGYMQEAGRNVDQVEADNQAYQDKFGSDGQALPLPGADGAAPGDAGGAGAGARTSADAGALPSLESLLESEGDGTFSVELLEADAPPGKVWKVITVTRGGKQFQQKRLVNAPKAGSGKKEPAKRAEPKPKAKPPAKAEKPKGKAADKKPAAKPAAKPKADPKAVHAEVAAALADPAKLTPEAVGALTEKLKTLTVAQIQAIQKDRAVVGGKDKADRVKRIIEHAKSKAAAGGGTAASPAAHPVERAHAQAKADYERLSDAHRAAGEAAKGARATADRARAAYAAEKNSRRPDRDKLDALSRDAGWYEAEAHKAEAAENAHLPEVRQAFDRLADAGDKLARHRAATGTAPPPPAKEPTVPTEAPAEKSAERHAVAHFGSPAEMAKPEHIRIRKGARASLASKGFGPGKTLSETDIVRASSNSPAAGKIAVAQLEKLGEIERVPGGDPWKPQYRTGPNWGKPEPEARA